MASEERLFKRLLRELTDGSKEQRKYASIQLAYSENPEALSYLEDAALRDESPEVRSFAVTAYGHLAGLPGVPVLVQSVDTPMNWLSSRSIDALERVLNNCSTLDELNRFEKGLDEGIRNLGEEKDERTMAKLRALGEKLSERRTALRGKMGGEPLGCKSCRLKHDKPSLKKKLKR